MFNRKKQSISNLFKDIQKFQQVAPTDPSRPAHRQKRRDVPFASMMPDAHTDVTLRVRVPYGE